MSRVSPVSPRSPLALDASHRPSFCSSNDLAALSRVQTSVREVAEYVLYSHIHFRAGTHVFVWEDDRSPLRTLAANPRKAAIVKAFYVQIKFGRPIPRRVAEARLVLTKVAKALENLFNLVDLRIIYKPMGDPSGRISQVIRSVTVVLTIQCDCLLGSGAIQRWLLQTSYIISRIFRSR